MLSEEQHLGPVDPTTMPAPEEVEPTEEEKKRDEERQKMPTADAMLLIDDFEYWAEKVLSGTAWNYYKSAADREISTFSFLLIQSIYIYFDEVEKKGKGLTG